LFISIGLNGGKDSPKEEKMKLVRDAVIKFPTLLAYSLEKRIQPRIEEMKREGIQVSFAPLSTFTSSEDRFVEWLSEQRADWSVAE